MRPFAAILPIVYLENSHNEGIRLRAHPTQTPLAKELFGESFAFEASYEEMSPRDSATVLLCSDDGVPLYGFHRVKLGECHYLNISQHHCSRIMQSPLRTAALSHAMERVWRWLYRECLERQGRLIPVTGEPRGPATR